MPTETNQDPIKIICN